MLNLAGNELALPTSADLSVGGVERLPFEPRGEGAERVRSRRDAPSLHDVFNRFDSILLWSELGPTG